MTEQEFEKNQPETGESTQSVVPSANETAEEQHQSEMNGTIVPENKPTGDYRQYNYQQEQTYDYGNIGYHADYSRSQKAGEEELDTRPLSMGEWALTLLALLIPCCGGIILYIFWAFSKKGNINRRNYCRAALIVMAGVAVVYFLVMSILGSAVFSYVQHYGVY